MAGREQVYKIDQVAIRMIREPPLYSTSPVDSPKRAAEFLTEVLADYDREVFCVVALDNKLRPININIASMGTLNAAMVHPREIFKSVVLSNAASMMLAHNHPGGNPFPSREDVETTDRLSKLGLMMDIPVMDHVITGKDGRYYSFRENAILKAEKSTYASRPEDIQFSGLAAEPGREYDREAAAKKRKEEIASITDRLENGVKELFDSEAYKAYLRTMSKFHHYSLNNTILIALQCPEASLVAGYKAWQKDHGRFVKKGEKGIRILAPAPYKAKVEQDVIDHATRQKVLDAHGNPMKETVEIERAGFKVTTVFDISQTEGKELPSIGVDELTGSVDRYETMKEALIAASPVPVLFEEIRGEAKGFYSTATNDVHVQTGMSEVQTLKTLIHEITHAVLHSLERAKEDPENRKDRHTKEVEAESVAFCVCQHYGIDTSDYSFAYVAGWSSGKDAPELRESLQVIRDTTDDLITEIDGRLKEQERSREKQFEKKSTPGLAMLNHLKERQTPQTPGRQIPKRREEAR